MTRKEELQAARNAFVNKSLGDLWSPAHSRLCELSFEAGAKWADKTMIDKAYEWLKENQDKYIEIKDGKLYVKRSMVIDLRKAMEE